jgi:hypothetical protein
MRSLILILLFLGITTLPAIDTLDAEERVLKELQKESSALMKEFLKNNWVIIVPEFEKQNKAFKDKTGKELNLKATLVVGKDFVRMRITNDLDPSQNQDSGKATLIDKNKELHIKHPVTNELLGKIIKKDGKLYYAPSDGTGEKYELKK